MLWPNSGVTMQQLTVVPLGYEDRYIVLDDYQVVYGNLRIVVPNYFRFDGASIPSIGWQLTYTPFHPKVLVAACVHDWLYTNHQVGRAMADKIFYDLLIMNGANAIKAKLMYCAVRIFGGSHWGYTDKEIRRLEELYTMCKYSLRFDEYHFPVGLL